MRLNGFNTFDLTRYAYIIITANYRCQLVYTAYMKSRRDYGRYTRIQSPQEFSDNWGEAISKTGTYLFWISVGVAGFAVLVRGVIPLLYDLINFGIYVIQTK